MICKSRITQWAVVKSGVTPAMTKMSTAAASEKNAVVTPKNASDLGVINSFGSKDVPSSGTGKGSEEGNKRKANEG